MKRKRYHLKYKKGAEAGSEKGGETTKELIDAGKEATGWNERDNPPIKKH